MTLARLVAVFFFLCCATAARADAVDDALAKFLDDKFPQTEQGVSELAATGAANAPAILDALGDNRLLIDPVAHIIVYQTAGGDLINAKTGEKLSGVDAEFVQEGARQQRASQRDRGGGRRADPRQSRSAQARQRRRSGVQVARRQGAGRARRAARAAKATPRRRRRCVRRARRSSSSTRRRRAPTASPPSRR